MSSKRRIVTADALIAVMAWQERAIIVTEIGRGVPAKSVKLRLLRPSPVQSYQIHLMGVLPACVGVFLQGDVHPRARPTKLHQG
ncbi:MAG: hypothetical protein M3R02_05750 [Chloroflexota bacterium]|nr:hypothetical protein [Chloroflexota bacterium]